MLNPNLKHNEQIIVMSSNEEEGIEINYFYYNTIYGNTLIASTNKGVCFVAFGKEDTIFEELKDRYSKAKLLKLNSKMHDKVLEYTENVNLEIDIPFHIKGSNFQIQVWNELIKIPVGETCNYKYIAEKLSNPKAIRAVGTAVGRNPISLLIPCHRVIRSDGLLGGYHWGLDLKEKMLKWESNQINSDHINI